jgi:hypothetical protein
MYPKRMTCDVMNTEYMNRVGEFDSMIGKKVVVKFDIDAREYQGKWYNSIRAYGIKEVLTEEEKVERKKEQQAKRRMTELGVIETPEGMVDVNGNEEQAVKGEGKENGEEEENKDDLPF